MVRCGVTDVFDLFCSGCFVIWWVAGRLYVGVAAPMRGRTSGLEGKR